MNLCILLSDDFVSDTKVQLQGRRAEHIIKVIKAKVGDSLKVGRLNGLVGQACIRELNKQSVILELQNPLATAPPALIPLTLILALPRPNMLQRSLQTIATMGVSKLCLIHTARVEKSFWQTPQLTDKKILQHFILGLEQGGATQLPELNLFKNFKQFVTHELDDICSSVNGIKPLKFIAHPGDYPQASSCQNQPCVLAIGPEGGFIETEINTFLSQGFSPIQLGQRILRVETAIPVTIGKLY